MNHTTALMMNKSRLTLTKIKPYNHLFSPLLGKKLRIAMIHMIYKNEVGA